MSYFIVSEGESVPCLSSSFWWLPATFGVPWFVAASLQSSSSSSSHGLLPLCLYVCLNLPLLSLMKTPVIGLSAHPKSGLLILEP